MAPRDDGLPDEGTPGENAPGEQPPGGGAPGEQPPGGEAPGEQPPGGEAPGEQPPGGEAPGEVPQSEGPPGGTTQAEGSSDRGLLGRLTSGSRRRKAGVVVLSVVVVVAGLFSAGVLGAPSGGVKDVGDWGEVTEKRTEVVTTMWVNNPNPFALNLGNMQADYRVHMNDVTVARGQKDGLKVEPGNNTVELHTYVKNGKLRPWWVAYVRNDETITTRVTGEATVGTPLGSTTVQFPARERTMLQNSTPIISAISRSASRIEGNYTRSVSLGATEVTAGYDVRRAWAEWGPVSTNSTTVLIHYRVHNPGDVALPAVPDGLRMNVTMNGIRMFVGGQDAMEVENTSGGAVLEPGETQHVVLAVTMDNGAIDDWFRSHVTNGERTEMEVELGLRFHSDRTGETFRLPRDGPAVFGCELQTAILVDDQETETTCGAAA